MTNLEIMGLIITIALVLVAAFLVPLLLQLRSTVKRVDEMLHDLQRDLGPLLSNLRETSERVNEMSETARQGVNRGAALFQAVGEVGDSIHSVNAVVNQITGRYVSNTAGLLLGVRAAARVFIDRMRRKGGK